MIDKCTLSSLRKSPFYNDYRVLYIQTASATDRNIFTCKKLFKNFIATIDQLFYLLSSEANTSSKASSETWIKIFAELYYYRFCEIRKNSPQLFVQEKYGYFTKYSASLAPISIYDYTWSVTLATTGMSQLSPTATEEEYQQYSAIRERIIYIYTEYLPSFFGIEYSKSLPKEKRYELICLIKILYDCSTTSPLGGKFIYLLTPSIIKFSSSIETTYKRDVNFIKRHLCARMLCSINSAHETCISNIIYMEKYANALKYFLDSFLYNAISHVVNHAKGNMTCSRKRKIMLSVYDKIIKNTKKSDFNHTDPYNHLKDPKAIAAYAYLHFLLTGVEGYFLSLKHKTTDDYYPEASPEFYDNLQIFPIDDLIDNEDSFSVFLNAQKNNIISHVPMGKGTKKSQLERFSDHTRYYVFLFTFFQKVIQKKDSPLTGKDALYIVMFYETIALDKKKIPLFEGYTKSEKRSLTIVHLLKDLEQRLNVTNIQALSDEEYVLTCLWLEERMIAFWDMRTAVIQDRMLKTRLAILQIWEKTFPFMTDEQTHPPSLNDFVATLLPQNDLKKLIEDA